MNKGYYTRLVNWLLNQGYTLTATSKNNSYYLNKNGITIRISDHIKADVAYTFQIFLSQFSNSYGVFFERQFISINSLKELKQLILQTDIILSLQVQKELHGVTPYRQKYEAAAEKVEEQKHIIQNLKRDLNTLLQSKKIKPGTLKQLEKAKQKITDQAEALKILNERVKMYKDIVNKYEPVK